MSVVPGDPASLSACASTARSVGHGLAGQASRVRATSRELAQGWTGRTSAGVRQRASGLADATDAAASELDRMGRVLQDHASDLADLVARGRRIEEQAREAGLEVRDGRVELGWGVTGTADVAADHDRARVQATLQGDLDLVLAQHQRRRDWVLAALRSSSATLAEISHDLRRG